MAGIGIVKVPAKDWVIAVDGTEILGINSIGRSSSKSSTDATTFAAAGRAVNIVTQRANEITLEGFFYEQVSDASRDPGQLAVEALALLTGTAALGSFTLTDPGGNVETFSASVELGTIGGGTNDATTWSATLKVSGAIT